MTRQEFVALLTRMEEGWNASDRDKVIACFAEDVFYIDPLRYVRKGRDELYRFFDVPEGASERSTWHTIIFDEETQTGAAEYTYEEAQRYHGLVLIRVAQGLVTEWREYQHVSDLDRNAFIGGQAIGSHTGG